MTKKLALAMLVASAALACPSAAGAGEIDFEGNPYQMYATFYTTYTGNPGERNDMRIEGTMNPANAATGETGGSVRFTDLAGIQSTPNYPYYSCTGADNTYSCGYYGHQGRAVSHYVKVALGDGDDKLAVRHTNYEADRLANQEQDCEPLSNKCVDFFSIDAGPGNDYLDVANGVNESRTVTCGDGYDIVLADSRDAVAADCESVSRSKATAAPERGGDLSASKRDYGYTARYDYRYVGRPGVANDMRIDRPTGPNDGFSEDGSFVIADMTLISSSVGRCTGAPLRYECPFNTTGAMVDPDTLAVELGDGADRIRAYDEIPAACADQPNPNFWRCPTITIDAGSGSDYIDLVDGRKGSVKTIVCGTGYDVVHRDAADAAASADCEAVTTS